MCGFLHMVLGTSLGDESNSISKQKIAWCLFRDVFMLWMRYDDCETDDSVDDDDWDERSAAGSVQVLEKKS
jgi:hypothetical protein